MSIPIQLPSQGPKNPQLEAVKKFFQKNQEKVILILGALLIAALAFGAGRLSINQSAVKLDKNSDIKGEVKIPIKREIQKQTTENIEKNDNKNTNNNEKNVEILEDESGYNEINANIEE